MQKEIKAKCNWESQTLTTTALHFQGTLQTLIYGNPKPILDVGFAANTKEVIRTGLLFCKINIYTIGYF